LTDLPGRGGDEGKRTNSGGIRAGAFERAAATESIVGSSFTAGAPSFTAGVCAADAT